MKKSKATARTTMISGIAILFAMIIAIVIAIIAYVPREYQEALAALKRYNQEGCSLLDQNMRQEFFGKAKIEECFNQDNYSSEAKKYAWKTANIDFDEKAVRLVQNDVDTMARNLSRLNDGDIDTAYKAVIQTMSNYQEDMKAGMAEKWGYTTEQIDNAFRKVLGQ